MVSKASAATKDEAAADTNGDGKLSQVERIDALEAQLKKLTKRIAQLEGSNEELRHVNAARLSSRGYEA